MNRTAFIIFENNKYEPDTSPSIIGICSTEEKAEKAYEILSAKNKFDSIFYSYEEYDLDKLTIFL